MLHIGQTYKTTKQAKKEAQEQEVADSGELNYFVETHLASNNKDYNNQRGILQFKNKECIIISSNTKSRDVRYNPWEDEFNEDIGYIHYYSDNKKANKDPADMPGNKSLLKQFKISQSSDPEVRKKAIPILFFESRNQGERTFHGYGTVESVKLVTQYTGMQNNKEYFSNYLFTFCVFSLKKEQEAFNWSWIDARRENSKYAEDLAPKEWNQWIKEGDFNRVRRRVYGRSMVKKKEQLPFTQNELDTWNKVYDFYKNDPYGFEFLAKDVMRLLIEKSGTSCHDGWVTKASGDGGVDYVLRIDIGDKGISQVRQVVLGQAKCYEKSNGVGGKDIDRIIARLKRGWIAAFVTMSYFTDAAQKEILEDNYPIMLINGRQVVQIINEHIYKENIRLEDYLENIDKEQAYKVPEDILKEE